MAAGLLIRWYHGIESIDEEIAGAINSSVLNLLLLPVIIYESGWSLRRQDFASQIVYILIFAIAGTVISVLVVGFLIHITNHWHGISSLRVAFAYASLISAVDPVATLATYASLQVEPLLNTMVFGESVVNDAVAIVLFQVLNSDAIFGPPNRMDESHAEGVFEHMSDQLHKMHAVEAEEGRFQSLSVTITLEVLKLLFGSILLGVGLGIFLHPYPEVFPDAGICDFADPLCVYFVLPHVLPGRGASWTVAHVRHHLGAVLLHHDECLREAPPVHRGRRPRLLLPEKRGDAGGHGGLPTCGRGGHHDRQQRLALQPVRDGGMPDRPRLRHLSPRAARELYQEMQVQEEGNDPDQ
jgi:hypothetical protein